MYVLAECYYTCCKYCQNNLNVFFKDIFYCKCGVYVHNICPVYKGNNLYSYALINVLILCINVSLIHLSLLMYQATILIHLLKLKILINGKPLGTPKAVPNTLFAHAHSSIACRGSSSASGSG